MTEKDIADAIFAVNKKVDWIALSFVKTPRFKDLQNLNCEHSD
jgi:pyruvate kinase